MKSDILLISELAAEWNCRIDEIHGLISEGMPCIVTGKTTYVRLSACQAWHRGKSIQSEKVEVHEVNLRDIQSLSEKGLFVTKTRSGGMYTATDGIETKRFERKTSCYKWLIERSRNGISTAL